jgi:hypothetical protein
MTDHTFAVNGLAYGRVQSLRAAADAAFNIPAVRAVGIDRTAGTITITSVRPVPVAEFAAAIKVAGFDLTNDRSIKNASAS